MDNPKILIVEDDPLVISCIKVILNEHNYQLAGVAQNSGEAMILVESKKPDLILMDIKLPGDIDGIDLTNIIHRRWDVPVVFLTSLNDDGLVDRAKKTAAYSFIMKDSGIKDQLAIIIEFALFRHIQEIQHQKALQELNDSEEKFRSIASTARDAIVFIDADQKISFWNKSASYIFGYSECEAIGAQLHNLIAPKAYMNFYDQGLKKIINEGEMGRTIEIPAIKADGSIFPIELALTPVNIKGKTCVCGIIRDISMRRNTEEELERLVEELQVSREVIEQQVMDLITLNQKITESEEELRETNASKDKFFSIIAHDLKNPFQGLLGYSKILSKNIATLDTEDAQELSEGIYQSANHLYKLLENLLEWSRIQRGVIEIHPENFFLVQIVEMNKSLLNGNASQKNISLINEVADNIEVFADINAINTTLRNLLSNAIKFTPEGGRITISTCLNGDTTATVSVSDTGIGMSHEDMQKVFKIDSSHSTLGTHGEKGTGLGLVLCKELVEKNGGRIWIDSELGKGTTFSFTLDIFTPTEEELRLMADE